MFRMSYVIRAAFLVIWGLLLASCGGGDPGSHYTFNVVNPAAISQAERIDVVFKNGGLPSRDKMIIGTEDEFNVLVTSLEAEIVAFNDSRLKTTLKVLLEANIDFEQFNLVIYSFGESSGSIKLTPLSPEVDSSGTIISIYIERYIPSGGTTDAPSYLLAYKLNKSISEIHFHNGPIVEQYKNVAGNNIIPINCQSLANCKD